MHPHFIVMKHNADAAAKRAAAPAAISNGRSAPISRFYSFLFQIFCVANKKQLRRKRPMSAKKTPDAVRSQMRSSRNKCDLRETSSKSIAAGWQV
jgi:hypothetical protein